MIGHKKRTLTLAGRLVVLIIGALMLMLNVILLQNVRAEQERNTLRLEQTRIMLDHARSEQTALMEQLATIKYLADVGSYTDVCAPGSTFKSFMDYRTITNTTSAQYALLERGFAISLQGILVQDGRYLVAMGPQYGPVGTDLTLELESDILRVRVADIKHTGCTSRDGSMLEFIVDSKQVYTEILASGNFNDLFGGEIRSIRYE